MANNPTIYLEKISLPVLGLVTLISVIGLFFDLKNFPPYLDFDTATDGIFINNLSYHDRYDFHFHESESFQDKYRVGWATVRLPYSIPLSLVQRAFDILPNQMELFSKILAGFFALGGLLCAARLAQLLLKQPDIIEKYSSLSEFLFILGMGCTYPPLLLISRSGFHFLMMIFFLFWAILLCVALYIGIDKTNFLLGNQNTKPKQIYYIYFASLLFAYAIMSPQVQVLAIIFCVIGLVCCQKKIAEFILSKHTYLAALLGLSSIIIMACFIVFNYTKDFQTYLSRIKLFTASRFQAASHESYSFTGFCERIEKILNQHVFFLKDTLGDTSRSDSIWTLGSSIWSFTWIFFPLVVIGAIISIKEKSALAKFSWVVILSFSLIFLVRFFPEGRYILPMVPCYIFFSIIAIRRLAKPLRNLAYTSLILLCMIPTYITLTSRYQQAMLNEYSSYQNILELSKVLPKIGPDTKAIIVLTNNWSYMASLYFGLLSNYQFIWINMEDLIAGIEKQIFKNQEIYLMTEFSQPLSNFLVEKTEHREVTSFKGRPNSKTNESSAFRLLKLKPL